MERRDTRRLTGPNLLWERPGSVVRIEARPADLERVVEAWRREAELLLKALDWNGEDTIVRRFHGGADLALSAPIDGLYTACELNELAWETACSALRGTNTFGRPRSASYLGISYSRIRWSRKVFQVSSATVR